METDVRMTRDGYLVMIHDATVDRTTNGSGKVADLTLAQVQSLRLRDDLGGLAASLTDMHVPTLDEMRSGTDDLPQVIARQASGAIRPTGHEVLRIPLASLALRQERLEDDDGPTALGWLHRRNRRR